MHSKFYNYIFGVQQVVKRTTTYKSLPVTNCATVQKAETDDQVEGIWDHRSDDLVTSFNLTTIDWVFLSYI